MISLNDFELRTLPGLDRWYDQDSRQLAFSAQSSAEAERWQVALRDQLARLLGDFSAPPCDPTPSLIESVADDGFRRDLIVIQTRPDEFMPCYVLTPSQAAAPYKPVLALHGHGTWGAKSLVGIADTPAEREFIDTYRMDFARKLAQQGYLVFVPALRGFGDRMEDAEDDEQHGHNEPEWLTSCYRLSLNALLSGKTLQGLRVCDVMRLIDYVQSRPDVQPGRLACTGISGGGTLTMYTAALDPRITCAYISGAVNTFHDSLMSIDHCLCNFIPNIVAYAEMGDLTGLIAPRPLVIEGGQHDPIYPLAGLQQAASILRRVYGAFGVPERFSIHIHDGKHRWDGAPINDWLAQYL